MTATKGATRDLIDLPTEAGVLRYYDIGDGPPLLLLHGSGPGVTGWRNYRGVVDSLASRFRCLILEFPGFGVSDPGPGHPMAMAASSVTQFLDGLALDKVDVIGNSLGGAIALQSAIAAPERIDRIVTIGGIGRSLLTPAPSEGIRLLMQFTDNPSRESLVRWLDAMVHDPGLITDELIEERWQLATDPTTLDIARRMYSSEAMAQMMNAAKSSQMTPYWAQLGRITSPVLATWGREDRVSPLDMSLIALSDIPNCELHVLPGCGHWAMIEARNSWLRVVTEFLTRDRP
ncbi:alpha/beta fold hydrolase [Gordonia sp. LSe1-13]|uniref:Alpha/beta fold hydrolase n=1 Tax=Gordonia sesuvii TaxID=3116777 RepID=A0ABU7MAS5_9ACTN|nr:alpha/beta fold hydrolase [Gordonia sp. LSe1-13]